MIDWPDTLRTPARGDHPLSGRGQVAPLVLDRAEAPPAATGPGHRTRPPALATPGA